MIFDTLNHAARYTSLGARLAAGLSYLQHTDLTTLPVGRLEIDGDNIYALVQEYTTRPAEAGVWESHRRYIDIQYMVSGTEQMGYASLSRMQLGEYIPEKDFQQMTGVGNMLEVFAGSFVIFFPEDGHMPGLTRDTPQPVRKVVLKIKL